VQNVGCLRRQRSRRCCRGTVTSASCMQVANTKAGIGQLLQRLNASCAKVQLICEASGGYEQALLRALQQNALALSLVQANRVRQFARAAGILAKTDGIDAAVLARFGAAMRPALFWIRFRVYLGGASRLRVHPIWGNEESPLSTAFPLRCPREQLDFQRALPAPYHCKKPLFFADLFYASDATVSCWSRCRSIFPVPVLGSASRNSIFSGTM